MATIQEWGLRYSVRFIEARSPQGFALSCRYVVLRVDQAEDGTGLTVYLGRPQQESPGVKAAGRGSSPEDGGGVS